MDRQPLTIVEIDLDFCSLAYGIGACTAVLGTTGAHKCFNGYRHCQAREAFDRVTRTLRFAQNVSGLPDVHLYPCLKSVSTRSAEVNLSGIDASSTALGRRAKVTVNLADFADSDLVLDPYAVERRTGAAQADGIGYDPLERSTFLRKLKVRFPFWQGRALRVLTGYVGDALEDFTARHYVISDWTGPDASGASTITAKDVFDLAEDDKAAIPTLSRGKLAANIDAAALSLTLDPASVGDEYDSAGRICVGSEVMTFTRAGDVLTVVRAQDGTAAAAHSAGDLAQQCVRFDREALPDALYRVLTEGDAGPIPADWIDLPDWQDEAVGWLGGIEVTTTLTKPYPRRKLAGELCQLGAMVWPDEIARTIRFRANRPIAPGETAYPLTDDGSFVERSGDITEGADERISRVFFWHGQMDVTKDPTGGENTKRGAVAWNQSAESPLEYGETMIEEIVSRWFGTTGNDGAASTVAERLSSRYRDPPRTFEGMIDQKDADNLALTYICRVTTRLIVDAYGEPEPTLMQIRSLEEAVAGHRARIKLQTFTFDGRFGFLMTDGDPDYDDATDAEKAEGCWMIDESETDFGDGRGPYVIF